LALLHEFDDNVAVVASATTVTSIVKITPVEVAGSTWGSVYVPWACPRRQRRQRAWLWRQQASSNFRLTSSLLKRPFASAANATSERSVSQREHSKRYGTLALRNARQSLQYINVGSAARNLTEN